MKRLLLVILAALLMAGPVQAIELQGGGPANRMGPALAINRLPPASQTAGQLWIVRDGTSGSDCSTGGGSTVVLCYSSGTSYTAFTAAGGTGDSPTYTGLTLSGLTASRPVGTDGSKALVSLTVTGTGAVVLASSPTLVTPTLGVATGTSLTLSGLTASVPLGTDANKLLVSLTPNGTGNPVMTTSATLVTPTLGVAAATSINKVAITAPATSATLTIADGKTLTASNTLTFTGTDSSSVAVGHGGTVSIIASAANTACATTCGNNTCVFGYDDGTDATVACANNIADHCVCVAA